MKVISSSLHACALLVALTIELGAAKSSAVSYKVKEAVPSPRGWIKQGPAPPEHIITLRLALPQPNFHVLEQRLYEVSDPDHELYGEHLSKEEVEELVAPHQETISVVDDWLFSHGILEKDVSRSPARDWVTINLPVSLVEKMLDTTYQVWKHASSGDYLVRTTSYSVPSHLYDHIDVIQPTTAFFRPKAAKSTFKVWGSLASTILHNQNSSDAKTIYDPKSGATVDAICNRTITISCLQQMYNAVGYVPSANSTSIGITGYLEQFANKEDLQSFYRMQRPDALNSSFKFISVDGGKNNQTLSEAGSEANLDVQFAFGLTHPIPGTFYSTAGRPPFHPSARTITNTNEPYAEWLHYVLSHPHPPHVISTSYGDDEQTVPKSYARRVCKEFAQLGARGVTLTVSSGDSGVGDGDPNPATQTCFTNDGRNATRFIANFPASCPFVTAVGGTTSIPEVAVSSFSSGGGFSDYFPRPRYQDKAVRHFLKKLPNGTYNGLFNSSGRGIPDVSAQSDNFIIAFGGNFSLVGGTSAASPTFAGFVALLNDHRHKEGQKPLGFLNPFLYSRGFVGLNDITVGKNPGCGTTGFNCTKGWDPVTGLGTPNFEKLKVLVTDPQGQI